MISLEIDVELVDGKWIGTAPWVEGDVEADSWFELYWKIVRLKHEAL